ncbi:hypothetical protein KC19_10G072900 [Ceratodon purpureus]|uniref:Uncharacterized protein n=1 Tax=Ceratodon purpureus TaxID=3225 RepID=A0A8T0GJ69_CERPU|nr:hypothetical protein KC19_N044800 [Ceratodon purpureus]KAG0559030.1 hypothetical protein KC19_10G072900 [Ceratodon purpureus]
MVLRYSAFMVRYQKSYVEWSPNFKVESQFAEGIFKWYVIHNQQPQGGVPYSVSDGPPTRNKQLDLRICPFKLGKHSGITCKRTNHHF